MMTAVASAAPAVERRAGINAVLGDDSWIAAFGIPPAASVAADDRIRVHLAFVEDLLRASEPQGLSEAQRAERARNVDRLHAYIERGEFPKNRVFAGTRPHFIDGDGRICAVGYLIEQSAGRLVAEAINAKHEWDYIGDIRGIDAWVAASGLTLNELAMIQPGYPDEPGLRPYPMPRPPPPPPPVDEGEIQRRAIVASLAATTDDVRACADRWGMGIDTLSVSITVQRFAIDVSVPRFGHRAFRRCVQRTVENAVAGRWFRRRTAPMTVGYTFDVRAVDNEWDYDYEYRDYEYRDRRNDGFSKPPPN